MSQHDTTRYMNYETLNSYEKREKFYLFFSDMNRFDTMSLYTNDNQYKT